MKDKAVVLAEVTKLKEIRDELTTTVDSLRIELEQERSKTRASNVDSKSTKQSVSICHYQICFEIIKLYEIILFCKTLFIY